MSFIDENLMPGEQVIYRTKPHWLIFSAPFIWLLASLFTLTLGSHYRMLNLQLLDSYPIYKAAALFFLCITAVTAISTYIAYSTSEFGITNNRVLIKVGFIHRATVEILLSRIESIGVYQSILGRILNYGSIIISGTGGSRDPFTHVPCPLEFRNFIHEQIATIQTRAITNEN